MNEQVLKINIGRIGLQRKIDAVQGDSGRVLKCVLIDYAIPPDASARIYAVKPSGAEIYNNCDITGNSSVSVELTTQMLAELGITMCQVEISKLEKRVTSFEFSIEVKKSLISDTAIESTDEFTALEEALAEARQVTAPVFDEAAERVNIQSGETIGTLFGKIKKWFTDLGAAAFYGVANNLTTTVANMVLDARQGKALDDKISELNRNIDSHKQLSYPDYRTVLSNALYIDIDDRYNDLNLGQQRVLQGTTANMPNGCSVGIREYYYFNQNWYVVRITELNPSLGRIWYNRYDKVSSSWSGWTVAP